MALEIETKLNIPETSLRRVLALDILKQASFMGVKLLKNSYFDTPELSLSANKVALRIREVKGKFIQTLKTQGSSVEGMHQRHEWEWEVPAFELQTALLETVNWQAPTVHPVDLSKLKIIFTTDFERKTWIYEDADGGRIEIALDQGEVNYTHDDGHIYRDAICELELELLSGSVDTLVKVTESIRKALPELTASDVSKAQRGFRLFEQAKA